jgi:transposase-like protein
MDPQQQWCHNLDCPARGRAGQGNIRVHSHKEQRYRCGTCGRTFAATHGTPFYRLHTAADWVTPVLILLCHGCPLQAPFDTSGSPPLAWMSARLGTGRRGQAAS